VNHWQLGPRWTKDRGMVVGSPEFIRPTATAHWRSPEVAGEGEGEVAMSGGCSLKHR
jgi:hypothetical protein